MHVIRVFGQGMAYLPEIHRFAGNTPQCISKGKQTMESQPTTVFEKAVNTYQML